VQQGVYKDLVIAVREGRAEKSQLPCVTISGTFKRHAISDLIHHSGFIGIDIDDDHNPGMTDFEKVRDQLAEISNVYFSGLSASGKGVFLIIPIYSPKQHTAHFEALKTDFQKQFGITIDNSCKDVSRLRYVSYDPGAKINPDAVVYRRIVEQKKPTPTKKIDLPASDNDILRMLERWMEKRGEYYMDGYKHKYLVKLAAACMRFGMSEFDAAGLLVRRYQRETAPAKDIEKIVNKVYSSYSKDFGIAGVHRPVNGRSEGRKASRANSL
jgi:hypothetical protein